MSAIAFLITNRYQIHHFAPIAKYLRDVTFVIEHRETDFAINEAFIAEHCPTAAIEHVEYRRLAALDGRHDLIVCQTPVLPQRLLERTLVVAQQYSLAKEAYQYGAWRSLVDLNLMYGPYSVERVQGFAVACPVGNPSLDLLFGSERRSPTADNSRGLYLPTYGSLSSLAAMIPRLASLDIEIHVKPHHAESPATVRSIPSNCVRLDPATPPSDALRECDFVITDYSGAAFDALLAGRPLLLVDESAPIERDLARLVPDELGRTTLAEVSTTWHRGEPILDAVARARALLTPDVHALLLDKYLVNPGAAAQACADAIVHLLDVGPTEQFGRARVRDAMTRQIRRDRSMSEENRQLRKDNAHLRSKGGRLANRVTEPAMRRVRSAVARHPDAEALLVKYKHRLAGGSPASKDRRTRLDSRQRSVVEDQLGWTVDDRRHNLSRKILDAFATFGEVVATDTDTGRLVLGIDSTRLGTAIRALDKVSEEIPSVVVEMRRVANQPTTPIPIRDVDPIRVRETSEMIVSSNGLHGEVLIVVTSAPDGRGRRYAVDGRSRVPDWTGATDADNATPAPYVDVRTVVRDVDVVYTWVDSGDPEWERAFEQYVPAAGRPDGPARSDRYASNDELRYSLRSLWTYAPFVRRIFLVTNGQRPSWISEHSNVTVVRHDEIFPSHDDLPTFNSHAIETCLHRIDGLSEHFLYVNDDVFIGREVEVADFFTIGGLPIVRFSAQHLTPWSTPDQDDIPTDWAAWNANQIIRDRFGIDVRGKLQHVPHPQRRSTLAALENDYRAQIATTRSSRVRSSTDLSLPSMLAGFYGVADGTAVESTERSYVYADAGRSDFDNRCTEIAAERPRMFCINTTKYRDVDRRDSLPMATALLDGLFPVASPYEHAS